MPAKQTGASVAMVASLIVLTLVLVGLSCAAFRQGWASDIFRSNLGSFSHTSFDRETWLDHSDEAELDNPRGHMLDDLIETRLHRGMTERRVLHLLGSPTQRFFPDREEYGWIVGRYRNCSQQVLIVEFNEQARLSDARALTPRDLCE